jgi:5-methylcytosine-specific restriction endonuclease McrA
MIDVNIYNVFPKYISTYFDRSKQYYIVRQHLTRASKRDLPATLTVDQWLVTLKDFGGRCAYCYEKPYQVLEHFIPLELGGGTTVDNCVPACRSCNLTKGPWSPFDLPYYYTRNAQRILAIAPKVKLYLETRRSEEVAL